MSLIVSTWLWGDAYGDHYVKRLADAVHRNLNEAHRFIAFTDYQRHLPPGIEQVRIQDTKLLSVKGCFARLRLFDPELQKQIGIAPGDRVMNLDLDLVITGPIDHLTSRDDDFNILQDINTTNPCRMNGSVWMLKGGERPDVWQDFSLENYNKLGVPFHSFPDDQGWFEHKFPQAGAYTAADGVYGFKKRHWPPGDGLPKNACVVAFPGWRDPSKLGHLDWIRANWR